VLTFILSQKGWEYSTDGTCEKMPSTKLVNVSIQALPCIEHEDMIWIWPGDGVPDADLPSLDAPAGFTTHAQVTCLNVWHVFGR
jgi:chlorophyllide a oxygenase